MDKSLRPLLEALSFPVGIVCANGIWIYVSPSLDELLSDEQRHSVMAVAINLSAWQQMWQMIRRARRCDVLVSKLAENLSSHALKSARLNLPDHGICFLLEFHSLKQKDPFVALRHMSDLRNRAARQAVKKSSEVELALDAAMTDALTQLPNRRHFEAVLQQLWQDYQKNRRMLTLLIVDIDFFKSVNDCLGHCQGDIVIQQLARVLQHSVTIDAALVARIGGEEFAILLPDLSFAQVISVCERIKQEVAACAIAHPVGQVQPYVTVSIGGCRIDVAQINEMTDLLRLADQALYQVKLTGRNHYHLYEG